jgi:SWIM zinc finger
VIEASVAQLLGERAEAELRRVRAVRPHLGSRCGRAEDILVSHLDCGGTSGVIRIRVRGEKLVGFLVRGSGGSVYRVEPWGSWRCSCPDHHRRGKACKHALACWALWRASARPAAEASPAEIPVELAPRRRSVGPARGRRGAELPVVSPERLEELAERLGVA